MLGGCPVRLPSNVSRPSPTVHDYVGYVIQPVMISQYAYSVGHKTTFYARFTAQSETVVESSDNSRLW